MSMVLKTMQVRDFAIIETLEIGFGPGFSVLSGETGAGKSILFDALGLILGDRADSAVVRDGAKRSEITASFDISGCQPARDWLMEQDLDDGDDELIVRRLILASGQSKAYINGSAAKLAQLRALGERLVEIHGQHAHQSLLKPAHQRRLLDQYGRHDDALSRLRVAHAALTEVQSALAQLDREGADGESRQQRIELLQYQLQELSELAPQDDEFEQLESDHRRQAQAEHLLQQAGQAQQQLYAGDNALYDQAQQIRARLEQLCDIDPRFSEAATLCEQAQIQLKEAAGLCEDLSADLEPDPQALAALSRRLDSWQAQARKHRVAPEQLPAHWQALEAELNRLQSSDKAREALLQQLQQQQAAYAECSQALSRQRKDSAQKLAAAITRNLHPLGLPHAQCLVQVEHDPQTSPGREGQDRIELLVAMNPGQSPGALAKVASGGELARTSLAIQVVCLDQSPVPILLFDEVDVGIGGGVAETVGRQLKSLASGYQVLCVTHQPQVAALADQHLRVSKQVEAAQTRTQVETLTPAQRIEELARMLGGVKITDQTRAHAEEMLAMGTSA